MSRQASSSSSLSLSLFFFFFFFGLSFIQLYKNTNKFYNLSFQIKNIKKSNKNVAHDGEFGCMGGGFVVAVVSVLLLFFFFLDHNNNHQTLLWTMLGYLLAVILELKANLC